MPIKSEWRITSMRILDEKMYNVYRLKDINEIDHSGNREYASDKYFRSREKAEKLLDSLTERRPKCTPTKKSSK